MAVSSMACRRLAIVPIAAFTVVSGAACGSSEPSESASPSTVTVTVTAAPSTDESDDGDSTSSTTTTATESDTPSELSTGASGRKLTLSDFFNPSSAWEEDRYDIADAKNVNGIATPVATCYSDSPQEIELRLGNNFKTFSFSVGQANNSTDSDQNVSVEVVGNNAQLEIKSVPFNVVQSFEIPVTGVNALKIRLVLDDKVADCGGSVIAVITDPVLA
jgi:hypothetical protein